MLVCSDAQGRVSPEHHLERAKSQWLYQAAGFFAFGNKRTSLGVSQTPEMRRFRVGRFLHTKKMGRGLHKKRIPPLYRWIRGFKTR